MELWDSLRAVVFDMDGVVFIGKQARRGIKELLVHLADIGIDYHILTNTSASSSEEISAKLQLMGLSIPPEKITTSSELTASYVRTMGAPAVFTLGGGNGLATALQAHGIEQWALERLSMQDVEQLNGMPELQAYPMVLGWTPVYNYEMAAKALRLEKRISTIFSTGEDRLFPDESGPQPGIQWLSGSIGALLQKAPVNVAKPNRYALDYVLEKLEQPPSKAAIIGDSLSDIQSGNEVGCMTILLLGGTTDRGQMEEQGGSCVASMVIEELTDLL